MSPVRFETSRDGEEKCSRESGRTKKASSQSLAVKISGIRAEIHRAPGCWRNGDLRIAVQALLAEHGVSFSRSFTRFHQLGVNSIIIWMSFRLECVSSGEVIESKFPALAQGYGSEQVNEAAVAAEKFWMFETFLAPPVEAVEPEW